MTHTPAAQDQAARESQPVLWVRDLTTVLNLRGGTVPVVKGVSFDVAAGETVALVGESGSGKSLTMLSVMGLLPPVAELTAGSVKLGDLDLTQANEDTRRAIRGNDMAMIYQDPLTSLNPLMRIGEQIAEVCTAHGRSSRDGHHRAIEVLEQVGIPHPRRAARSYPHEFSGGMRQRVLIAMALALRPRVLIADEPTTALDVTIQQQIITLVDELQQAYGLAVVWVTHDLGVVARIADRVMVMYAGHLVERAETTALYQRPEHPYTADLIAAIPPVRGEERGLLNQIPGAPPDPANAPRGCPYHPRCRQSIDRCVDEMPPLTDRGHSEAACWVPPENWT